MGIPAARCFATKHHANQPNIVARNGGNKIKARGVDIACFDAISAVKFAQ